MRGGNFSDRWRYLFAQFASLCNTVDAVSDMAVGGASERYGEQPFNATQAGQMLPAISDSGHIRKNRHGQCSFAAPMMAAFIQRLNDENDPDAR